MNKNKIFITLSTAIFIIITIAWLTGLQNAFQQPDYRDGYNISISDGYLCVVNRMNQKIEQNFEVPYDDTLEGLSLQIGTFSGDSRSQWKAEISEVKTGQQIYEGVFDARDIKDNQYYNILSHSIEVEKNKKYILVISPVRLDNKWGLAFYADDKGKQGHFTGGENDASFDLAMKTCSIVDNNGFWARIYIAAYLYVLIIFVRSWVLYKKRVPWYRDKIVQTMFLMLVYCFLLQGILNISPFTDENDNIRGGMLIAQGKVIYRDYITQHMPFMYYLCGIFALMGAGSIPQFRLLFYIFCAGIIGFIYFRNGEKFGKIRICLFAILHPAVMYTLHASYGLRILSDNIMALGMAVLLLEYLDYRKTFKIDLGRSLTVAAAVYVSFGCAFLSAYPISVIVIGVIITETAQFRKSGQPVSFYVKRYRALFLSCLIPFILTAAYFLVNHTLSLAYEMAFLFNTEVYSKYNGLGSAKLEPFINGVKNYFSMIVYTIRTISTQYTERCVLELLILLIIAVCIGKGLRKKEYFTRVSEFLFLCLCFTRDSEMGDFHAAPFWCVALLIAFLDIGFGENQKIVEKQAFAMAAILGVLTYMPYIATLKENIFSDHTVEINDWERFVVTNTEEDDSILMDCFRYESLYLQYKGIDIVNTLPYFLPWYMEWYQEDTIEELRENQPVFVLYDPQSTVWDITGFMEDLRKQVDKDYILDEKTGIYIRK